LVGALEMKADGQSKVGPSEASSRLDEELKLKIKRAMEKAFKHFDTDHSNTIDVDEFAEVLRSLGQDMTSREIKNILKRMGRHAEVSTEHYGS